MKSEKLQVKNGSLPKGWRKVKLGDMELDLVNMFEEALEPSVIRLRYLRYFNKIIFL